MKKFVCGILSVLFVSSGVRAGVDQVQYAQITQDSISFNETSLLFNDQPVSMKELPGRLKSSYSISFHLYNPKSSKVSIQQVLRILDVIAKTKIEDELIDLDVVCFPPSDGSKYDTLLIQSDGSLVLEGQPVELSELSQRLDPKRKVAIHVNYRKPVPPFSRIKAVLGLLDASSIHDLYIANHNQQIQVKAQLIELDDNGSETLLSSPSMTSESGCMGVVGVVENGSGYKPFSPLTDPYHQEDLANLGTRFSITSQLIGKYIRISGVIELVKAGDKQEAFHDGNVPIYSYSSNKMVSPFCAVLAPGEKCVEVPVASLRGKKTICRLYATLVDDHGKPLSQREAKRAGDAALKD